MSRKTNRLRQQTTPCLYLGIDIAKSEFAVALLADEELVGEGIFANTKGDFAKLTSWRGRQMKAYGEVSLHACMEATGSYSVVLAFYLQERFAGTAHRVSVVNPLQTNHHAKSRLLRNKTDRVDAENIAHFCATHHPAD